MKRVVFLISLIVMVLSIDYLSNTIIEYFNSSSSLTINRNIKNTESKIDKINEEINEKRNVVSEIEKNNEDKVKLLEVWKKELEKTDF